MPARDKYWYIPWIGVVICALILGVAGRYIGLKVSGDAGTADLVFLIVAGGVVFLYLLFIALWDSIQQAVTKQKRRAGKDSAEEKPEEFGKLPEGSALRQKIEAYCAYTDNILAGHVAPDDLPLLHKYIEQYAQRNLDEIPRKIETNTVDTFDLCHYGWNIWNHFRVVRQPETAEWLIRVFEQLKDCNPTTLYKKFTHAERETYTIPREHKIK